MPKGPKGQKRPADVIGNAVHVMKVLTGEADDEAPDDGKDKAAQELYYVTITNYGDRCVNP